MKKMSFFFSFFSTLYSSLSFTCIFSPYARIFLIRRLSESSPNVIRLTNVLCKSDTKSSRVLPDRWRSRLCAGALICEQMIEFLLFRLHMISEIGTGGEFSSLFCVCVWFYDFLRLLRVRADMWHIL